MRLYACVCVYVCACVLHLYIFNILPLLMAQRRSVAPILMAAMCRMCKKCRCKFANACGSAQNEICYMLAQQQKQNRNLITSASVSLDFAWLVGTKSFHCGESAQLLQQADELVRLGAARRTHNS